jgi:hypothetical protein
LAQTESAPLDDRLKVKGLAQAPAPLRAPNGAQWRTSLSPLEGDLTADGAQCALMDTLTITGKKIRLQQMGDHWGEDTPAPRSSPISLTAFYSGDSQQILTVKTGPAEQLSIQDFGMAMPTLEAIIVTV